MHKFSAVYKVIIYVDPQAEFMSADVLTGHKEFTVPSLAWCNPAIKLTNQNQESHPPLPPPPPPPVSYVTKLLQKISSLRAAGRTLKQKSRNPHAWRFNEKSEKRVNN